MYSFVYGASDKKGRDDLFTQLEGLKPHISGPWLIMGDFNCIANLDERIGQRPRTHELEPLRRSMEVCEVHVLKSTSRFFTWTNKQQGTRRVLSEIDCVLSNQAWECTFPTLEAVFLLEGDFDHTSMLVHFFMQHKRTRMFMYFNHWGKREDFIEALEDI